ncbi:hypothetical protein BMS3Abin03_01241 [bacterium BMS3Abin03]|nr:hypothetical protein BMS3Abin03_01241 [bacterium BMS3Abin03]
MKQLVNFNGKRREIGTYFKIQLKTSSNWSVRNDKIVYDLEAKTYNDIILHNRNGVTKLILILMRLEKNKNNWCSLDHNYIQFKNSLFWFHTESVSHTDNEHYKRIEIPVSQVFNNNSIVKLIDKFKIKIIR